MITKLAMLAMVAMLATLAAAQREYRGKLVDTDCKRNDSEQACPITELTLRYGIVLNDGSFLAFDSNGDRLARAIAAARGISLVGRTATAKGKLLQDEEELLVEALTIK